MPRVGRRVPLRDHAAREPPILDDGSVPSAPGRRRNTVALAKNIMRRSVNEILDPSPRSVEPLWEHFESRCAYCGKALDRDRREGHVDHAAPDGGNQLGNLLLSCAACNGDEKREQSWEDFLAVKASRAEYAARRQRINEWFALHPRTPLPNSAEIAHLRGEIDKLIEDFAATCAELKKLVSTHGGQQQ